MVRKKSVIKLDMWLTVIWMLLNMHTTSESSSVVHAEMFLHSILYEYILSTGYLKVITSIWTVPVYAHTIVVREVLNKHKNEKEKIIRKICRVFTLNFCKILEMTNLESEMNVSLSTVRMYPSLSRIQETDLERVFL